MKILLAEDDNTNGEYIHKGLTEQGYTIDWVKDGREALTACLYNEIDLAIIDRMMPELDGLSVVKALRSAKCDIPVIFLTALGDVDDRVEGLLAGGDDYIVKPFHLSELLARIVVLGRRPKATTDNTLLQVHDLTLNLLTREAHRQGQFIELAGKEFALLEILMQNAGHIITKTTLLEKVWDFNFNPGTTIIETHISNLRQKIDKPFNISLLHTVRNMGYCLRAPK
ncbi:response regulator transcription factor [Phocoenobacter atlanticus subsp. cyclopteri]|uniref:response regulator transcription factor n=1 Tax=Phocoenobacter atlanticus TaxID=3416742 RepID=UPI001BCA2CA0|nr:response regulator transcription factor [Pasteurella atlantica]QVE21469.1 response regulator transcription factor [Pasteurella atlantica]